MSDGKSWSESGYRTALKIRTSKTILVEGTTEKELLNRLILDLPETNVSYVIDTASLLSGDGYNCLGNKKKIEKTIKNIDHEYWQEKRFAVLMDREWDDLVDKNGNFLKWKKKLTSKDGIFYTEGHSIENYSFNIEYIISYIKYCGGNLPNLKLEKKVRETFSSILSLSLAFSHEVWRHKCINKMYGVVKLSDVGLVDNKLCLMSNVDEEILKRNINLPSSFVSDVNNKSIEYSKLIDDSDLYRYIHGHLGECIILACVAALIRILCGKSIKKQQFFSVGTQERKRYFNDWMAKRGALIPFDDLIYYIFGTNRR